MKNEISNLQGKMVRVTMRGLAGKETVFTGKVVDYTTSYTSIIWVERTEDGEWVGVNLSNPNINTVEEIEKEIKSVAHNELKEIHKNLNKVIKYNDEDEIKVMVKVYDCFENDEQTYDVEINYAIGDDCYTDGYTNTIFTGRFESDEDAEKQAVKRAKAVLKTVKGWFKGYDYITVEEGVEVYHA